MTTALDTVALLMADLVRRGIELGADGGKLRYRPRDRMTPALADRLKAHRSDVLAILGALSGPADGTRPAAGHGAAASYSQRERDLLDAVDARPGDLRLVDAVKTFDRLVDDYGSRFAGHMRVAPPAGE